MDTKDTIKNGLSFNTNGEHRLVIGEAPKEIAFSKDVELNDLTMTGLVNFVKARKEAILARKGETHFEVESRSASITLVVGEHGGRKLLEDKDRVPSLTLSAEAQFSDDYEKVCAYMGKTHRSAHTLAMDFRKLPHLFENTSEWQRVFNALRKTDLRIEKIQKETSEDRGAREQRLSAEVTDGQLDLSWNFFVPIYEGEEKSLVTAKALWEVQSDFSVAVVLLGTDFKQQQREALKAMTKRTIDAVEEHLGQGVIPVMYFDTEYAQE